MSEQKLISPLLDGFVVGNPLNAHNGVRCCPAMKENADEKYIVKIISVPASQVQLEALLLTGAYSNPAEAADYFREVAESIVKEAEFLNSVAKLEGFLPFEGWQIVPMEDGKIGYEVYLLSKYRRSLQRYLRRNPITHLEAVNLGLDLCAALAICRRAGSIYVNLKPANVFFSKGKEFRIGDLGFIRLDSLEYTSLPGKYRSPYTPREAQDDLKTLNTTVDTYAVGMILYQVYNEGELPAPPLEPKDPFPCPANADYEISAIIMKAIDPDPARRWATPMEMGQALVAYMQRNTINNVPITPPTGIPLTQSPALADLPADTSDGEDTESIAVPIPVSNQPEPEIPEPDFREPQPVAPPKSPEPEPDPISPEEDPDDLDFSIAFLEPGEGLPAEPEEETIPEPVVRKPVRRETNRSIKQLISAVITLSILVVLACGAFWFYQTQYLQTIDALTVDGTQNQLTVTVKSDMDMSLLEVSCTDTYGNTTRQPVVNGTATFTDLLPDSLYRIELSVSGFHQLMGKTAEIFTTDALTNMVAISAVTGPEDGSVMVSFTVDGPEPDEWVITCTAEGEEAIQQSFTGHTVTVKGLTVGKVYTLQLGTADNAQILGTNTLEFGATRLIMAQNLTIVSCEEGNMTVRWDAPEDATVDRWGVRCYNDDGHEEVLEISGTEIVFTGIERDKSYTVEVTADGMTQPSRVSITANPLTITELTVNADNPGKLTVDWTWEGNAPEGGWLLLYTLDGQEDQPGVVKCEQANAVIENRIPSAEYTFVVQAADSTSIFNNIHTFVCPNAGIYANEGLSADNITAVLLKTPEEEGWTFESVDEDSFTDTFQSGDKISVVLKADDNFYLPEMDIPVMYVIRDGGGHVLPQYISRETIDWKSLWYDDDYHNGELNVPSVPTEPGSYSLSIYFNNLAVTVINFTIAE